MYDLKKLPLDYVKSCLDLGWVTPVMKDPTYSRLTIYKLTEKGEQVLSNRRG